MTMTAKFDGKCKRCGGRLPKGTVITWSRESGAMHADLAACTAVLEAPTAEAPTAHGAPIAAFLQAAQARGLKFPKARFLAPGGGELRLSVAGEQSRYPGAIQVKLNDEWVGRINVDGTIGGRLSDWREGIAALSTIAADPATAAKAFGALMGRCSFCDKALTDEGSVEVGYGPVCAKKYGLPHTAKGTRQLAAPLFTEAA